MEREEFKLLLMAICYGKLAPRKLFVEIASEETFRKLVKISSENSKYSDLVLQLGRNQTFVNMPLYEELLLERHRKQNKKNVRELKETQKLMKRQGILRKDII